MLAGQFDTYLITDAHEDAIMRSVRRVSDGKQCLLFLLADVQVDLSKNILRYAMGLAGRMPNTLAHYIDVVTDEIKNAIYLVSMHPSSPSLSEVMRIKSVNRIPFTEAELCGIYSQLHDAVTLLSDTPGYARLFSSHGAISANTIFIEESSHILLVGYGINVNGGLESDIRDTAKLLTQLMTQSIFPESAHAYTPEFYAFIQRLEVATEFPPLTLDAPRTDRVTESVSNSTNADKTVIQSSRPLELSLLLSATSQGGGPTGSPGAMNAPQVELSTTRLASSSRAFHQQTHTQNLPQYAGSFSKDSYDSLLEAVRQKNLEYVTTLVGYGMLPPPSCPKTGLMEAATLGYYEIAQILVATEARRISSDGHTALHYALENGHFNVVSLLTELEGRKYSVPFLNNTTNLLFAVETEDIDAVWYWHKNQSTMVDSEGFTALHRATLKNYLAAVRILAQSEHGIADKTGKVALHYCAENNYIQITKVLAPLEQGILTPDGLTSLQIAYNNGFLELARELVQYEGPKDTVPTVESHYNTDLMLAVINKSSFNLFCYLHQARSRNIQGLTALMLAARNGNQSAIDDLIELEGKMRVECPEGTSDGVPSELLGQTALMLAAGAGMLSAAAQLSAKEAGMTDITGETALMKAVRGNYPDIVDLLAPLENNIRNNADKTALTLAICLKHSEICEILRHYEGPLPDASSVGNPENSNMTALMKAADAGNFNYVWCLKEQRNCIDAKGRTALMYAASRGHLDCCELLLDTKNVVSMEGETAWMIANNNGHTHLLELLRPDTTLDENGNSEIHRLALTEECANTKRYTHQYRTYNAAGLTALMVRASTKIQGSIDLSLLEAEAGMRSKDGKTFALKIALLSGNTDVVDMLLPLEQDLLNEEGYTDLMIDAFYGHLDHVVAKGTQYRRQAKDGISALMLACAAGQVGVARLLLGSEIGLQAQEGLNASKFAIQSGNSELCNLIVPLELNFVPMTSVSVGSGFGSFPNANAIQSEFEGQQNDRAAESVEGSRLKGMVNSLNVDIGTLKRWEKQLGQNHHVLQRIIGPSPSVDNTGNTVLHRAALNGDLATVRESIFMAKTTNNMRQTALMFAAARGHAGIVELLVHYEANIVDVDNYFAAELAIISGHVDCIAILAPVEKHLLLNAGYTSLMFSVLADDMDSALRYIKAKQLRLQTRAGQTALMIAVLLARVNFIPLLIEERDLCMKNGITAFDLASAPARKGFFDVKMIDSLKVPIELDSAGNTQLMQKAACGNVEYVKAFIYMHNNYNNKGYTALHLAVLNNHPKCVNVLKTVEVGLRLRGSFEPGMKFPVVEPTALMIAAILNSSECISELLAGEATFKDAKGRTALMLAAIYGNADACALLAPYEAGFCDAFDMTALMLSATYGHANCTKILTEFEANKSTPAGTAALTYASQYGHISCVEALAPSEGKEHGVRALNVAKDAQRSEIQRIIQRYL